MAYQTYVYRSSGGDQLDVDSSGRIKIGSGGEIDILSGGRLEIAGTAFVTSGGNLAIGSLTSGNITTTGSITLTSGLNASSGTFTNVVAVTSGITALNVSLTSGVTATTGNFSGGVALSSGISGTTGNFSSGFAIGGNLAVTSGVNATTGQFSGAVTVGGSLTLSSAVVVAFEQPATGVANPYMLAGYGVSVVWSSGSDSTAGRRWNLPAPVAGRDLWVVCTKSTATAPAILSSTGSTGLFDKLNTLVIFSSGAVTPDWVHLLGENSTNWITLGRSTGVTVSAT